MNNLVNVEYDNFEKKKSVRLKNFISPSVIDNTLGLEHVDILFTADQEGDNEPLINLFLGHNPCNLGQVRFLIKLDDKDILSCDALVSEEKGAICDITNIFSKICEAHTIEIRLKNNNGHIDLSSQHFGIGARAIYNAIIDDNAYIDEIQKQEQIDAEDNKIVEQEKITNIEKYAQRDNRIKNRGVNKFFKAEYDKFKQKLEVTYNGELELETLNATMMLIKSKFDFRYVHVSENNPTLIIDIEAISKTGLNLKEGELMLLLNDSERLILNPHENYSEPYLESYHIESCWYALTENELKTLCDAHSIEMRITNTHEYADISAKDVQLLARRFYNAIIDETAYVEDLLSIAEREAAERERLRKEREEKEAEEARIRAEKRAEWWKKNGKKVWIAIGIITAIILAIIAVNKIQNTIAERQLNQKVEAAFLSGDSCVNVFAFEEARSFYTKAGELKGDKETKDKVGAKFANLRDAEKKAQQEYDAALKKLKILLDADDYEFNQYSNECLDKMIKLNRSRQETIYYLKIRNNPEDQKILESLNVDGKTSATEQIR